MTTPLAGARNHPIAAGVVAAAIAALFVLAGCGTGGSSQPLSVIATPMPLPTEPAPGAQTIAMAGSSQVAPLLALWASAYHQQYPQVTLAATGPDELLVGVARGRAITALNRFLTPAETTRYRNLRNIPVAVSGLAVVYHVPQLGQAQPLKLNGKLLSRIYTGKITTWNNPAIKAINPGLPLPATKIVPVRGADGGNWFDAYLTEQVKPASLPKLPRPTVGSGGQMLSAVSKTPGAIGYVSLSYSGQITADKLGEAALRNGGRGYVLPQPAGIEAAADDFTTAMDADQSQALINGTQPKAYPIANYEYAVVSAVQPNMLVAHDVKSFMYWMLTGGTAQLPEMNLQPLPPAVATLSQDQIAMIRGVVPKPRPKPKRR